MNFPLGLSLEFWPRIDSVRIRRPPAVYFSIQVFLAVSFWRNYGFAPVEESYAGTLEGTVHYLGFQPASKIMKVAKDQDHCGAEVGIQTIHLHDPHGGLSATVVSVEGLKQDAQKKQTERRF